MIPIFHLAYMDSDRPHRHSQGHAGFVVIGQEPSLACDKSSQGYVLMSANEPETSRPLNILYAIVAAMLLWAILRSAFVAIELW